MAEAARILPSAELRTDLSQRGAGTVSRCYQCATCASVCDLSKPESPFPRQQMLLAQWGLADRLAADPAIWLCHQCADCTERCPRDVRPGDVLQGLRASVIRNLAFPAVLGKLVSRASVTWPLLLFGPWLFWILLLWALDMLTVPEGTIIYEKFVPHGLLYAVFFPVAGWVTLAATVSGWRFWKQLGVAKPRQGTFLGQLKDVLIGIAVHREFSSCATVPSRRWGHLALVWGFVGAAATSGLLIIAIYGMGMELPIPQLHPFKILGNISAVLLVVGGLLLLVSRYSSHRSLISTSAFDSFFLIVVALVIASGVIIEVARYVMPPLGAYALYTVHLGVVMTLFLTFPYSKFAHMLFRTIALVHHRATAGSTGRG